MKPITALKNLFFWLTYPMTRIKSILWMIGLAGLFWGVPIWYNEKNPERYLMGDFERWEIWWAIAGFFLALAIVLLLTRQANKRKKNEALSDHIKNQ